MNPFATIPEQQLSSLGETELIRRIKSWLGDANPPEPHGIGDDCSVLPLVPSCQQLVTTDPVIYGKHFDDSLSPEQAAAKLLKRNVSDIAAMGGVPKYATVALALDSRVSIDWINRFYLALAANARSFDLRIVGGDISSAENFLGVFLTLIGQTLPNTRPLLRTGATENAHLYVTGSLGGTRIQKHHTFTPRVAEGQWLASNPLCLACTDLSDGLGKDLHNLLSPNLATTIDCSQLPISADAHTTAKQSGKPPLYHVFNDGEDFELLFAIDPSADIDSFEAAWSRDLSTPLHRIGKLVARTDPDAAPILLQNAPDSLTLSGYEHLR